MGIATKLFLAGIACLVFSCIGHAAYYGRNYTYYWLFRWCNRIAGKVEVAITKLRMKLAHKEMVASAKVEENK